MSTELFYIDIGIDEEVVLAYIRNREKEEGISNNFCSASRRPPNGGQ